MQILFVSPYVPSPIRVRPYQFLRALARRGHRVTLVCSAGSTDQQALSDMRQVCEHVIPVQLGKLALLRNAVRALPGQMPLQAAINFDPRLLAAVQLEAHSGRYDVAHIEHLRGSALAYGLGDLPVLLDSVDSISLLFERTLRSSPSLKSRIMAFVDLARTRRHEGEYVERYDQVIVSSPEDAWAIAQLSRPGSAESIAVVPNGVDLEYFVPQQVERAPATLVFSGKMAYHANEAAARYLVQEIMPLVWAAQPAVRVVIAGSGPSRAVQALAQDERVDVTGYLPDLRPVLASATLAVCPLRYGVGIQNKILEAMAMATPVIAARQTTRALHAIEGQELLLADEPHAYASAILALLNDSERAKTLGAAGRSYVERHHSWDSAARQLEAYYRHIAMLDGHALARKALAHVE